MSITIASEENPLNLCSKEEGKRIYPIYLKLRSWLEVITI